MPSETSGTKTVYSEQWTSATNQVADIEATICTGDRAESHWVGVSQVRVELYQDLGDLIPDDAIELGKRLIAAGEAANAASLAAHNEGSGNAG